MPDYRRKPNSLLDDLKFHSLDEILQVVGGDRIFVGATSNLPFTKQPALAWTNCCAEF